MSGDNLKREVVKLNDCMDTRLEFPNYTPRVVDIIQIENIVILNIDDVKMILEELKKRQR